MYCSHIPEQKGARNTKVLQHARKLNISSTSSLESSKDTINSNSSDSTYGMLCVICFNMLHSYLSN